MGDRKKPKFLRKDWHKKIRLGRTVKKVRKWRAAKGRHNKIRLNRKGHSRRPKIGWGTSREEVEAMRIMNVGELVKADKKVGVVIGAVGMKKRKEIVAKANEMKIKVLNKYKVVEEEK
jgi:ribosomal protein L32E